MDDKQNNEDKSVKVPSLFHSFAVIVLLLVAITVFNATIRTILGTTTTGNHGKRPINLIYDRDLLTNWTKVCPTDLTIDNLFYQREWRGSCYNKTLHYWYIPWIRAWVWMKFDDIIAEKRRLKELENQPKQPESAQNNTTEELNEDITNETEEMKIETKKEPPPPPSSTVYTILTAMTLMLTIIALMEVFRDKFGKKPEEARGRRCSLAEFTIKRHERKESQENLQRQAAFDEPKKVKELHHQGSLDRAISVLTPAVKSSARLPRQRSMPSRCPSLTNLERPSLPILRSVDLPEDDGSPASRRKSRHFIRRH